MIMQLRGAVFEQLLGNDLFYTRQPRGTTLTLLVPVIDRAASSFMISQRRIRCWETRRNVCSMTYHLDVMLGTEMQGANSSS